MINKFLIRNLLNTEFFQFLVNVCSIFARYKIDFDRLQPLYEELESHTKQLEISLAAEKKNEKIREKNEMDRRRDRLHSRLFNYLKYITYSDSDPRYDDAQDVLQTIRAMGNPTQLSENRQTALMTLLGNRLEPLREKLREIGALEIVDEMMEANRQFIVLEEQARDAAAAYKLENTPSAGNVRKEADAIYRSIVEAMNVDAKLPHKKDMYVEIANDLNIIVDRYNAMIAARKRSAKTEVKKENDNQ